MTETDPGSPRWDAAGDFLERPLSEMVGPMLVEEMSRSEAVVPGVRVGPYRAIREAGRGGMGVVFVADRDDGEYHKRVALKLLVRRPSTDAQSLRRFREERQILASLEHPGIARMLDGGVMTNGTPWFAMEYVDGTPIDAYCATGQLDVRARLELFASVCDAVQYAHERSIVHRDIKPANILVAADGAVKLLDFGIARLVSADDDGDREATLPGSPPMTPDYASPEQLCGESASAASDVYALGIVLYQLLAGEHPHRRSGESWREMRRRILNEATPHLPADLPAELDAITTTALRTKPALRYRSAGALAADVRAVVSGGRTHRSTQRRRRALAWSVAAVLVLALGVVIGRRVASPQPNPLAALAVLPLQPTAEDSALARFGRQMVVTLSSDLDGLGDIRTVDARDARSVIRGSLTRVRDLVRIDAGLYPIDEKTPLARASAFVHVNDVAAATDSVRSQLLRDLWKGRNRPVPNPAAVTTNSVAALRAYLKGERAVTENRMPAAALAFSNAIESDSSFWFAYWRLAWAREFMNRRVDSNVAVVYRAHRGEFPERDRILIKARMAPRLGDRIALTRQATELFADYWPAWLDLGELLVHQGPYAGVPLAEARAPLVRALRLKPGLMPAWDHLFMVSLTDLDTVGSAQALTELEALHYDAALTPNDGTPMLVLYRYLDRLARTSGVSAGVDLDSIAKLLSQDSRPDESRFQGGHSRYGFHAARIELGRHVLRLPSLSRERTAFEWQEMATTWASRHAWDSAFVAADRATSLVPNPARVLFTYRLAAIGAWLGEVDASVAAQRRSAGVLALDQLPPPGKAELAWTDGVLAAARHDPSGLTRARAALHGATVPTAALVDSSLLAFELDLSGKRAQAIDVMTRVESDRFRSLPLRHPYLAGINRLALSRWLRDAGRPGDAARLLGWHEAVVIDVQTAHANALLAGVAYLERARIEEAKGPRELALEDYRQFLRREDGTSAARQGLVEEARKAIARLSH